MTEPFVSRELSFRRRDRSGFVVSVRLGSGLGRMIILPCRAYAILHVGDNARGAVSYPVDIVVLGLRCVWSACDLLRLKRLFSADHTAEDLYEAAHLAGSIAVLGLPPAAFLALNPEVVAHF
ncbi:uncharacterized protein N7518_006994 [Penicillium psychrosexuale]|uniref:uncharacterized protein n=1 Tax=Penicillium psychrosexuale TaxID=1002107 RepID=UPI0025455A34|nr:uncharacterized protein N7518_006994 [Penicillium psychrosexuale]KAJ5789983.1 hypothetical protein N7518_006994 [Penicillium psychrosexuale]